MGPGICNLWSSALAAWTCLISITASSPVITEGQSKYTLHRWDISTLSGRDDPAVWPWPANKSSVVDEASKPDMPPQNLTLSGSPITTLGQISRNFIEKKCDAGQKFKIKEAWKDAKLLADAQTKTVLGYNYDIPHTQWLGKDWNSDGWSFWKWDYRSMIAKNMVRSWGIYSDNAPEHDYIYWYCYDYSGLCTEGVYAYSWDEEGLVWSNHYTVFCGLFFARMSLSDNMKKYANDKNEQKVMENFQLNRAQVMFHETWHYKYLVSDPRAKDYAYQAQKTWKLAKDKGTNWAYVNAYSYALDGLAIYVQQYYKSSMSPVPIRELKHFDADAAGAVSAPPADNAIARTLDARPPGWVGPLSNTEKADMSVWEEVKDDNQRDEPPPAAGPALTCTGVDNTNWMGRDALKDAIDKFCGNAVAQGTPDPNSGSLVRKYNNGGPDQVTISIDWLLQSYKPAMDSCVASFTTVMDSCDGSDPTHNPLNWKHGGHNQASDARYNIFPTAQRYEAGICSMHIHEKEDFSGTDGPGTERKHTFHLQDDAKDSVGKTFAGTGATAVEAGQGGGNPYTLVGYYDTLLVTPEAQGDYIQFSIGQQSWTTKDGTGVPRCQVGGWDSDFTPVARDIDCFFNC